MPAASTAEYRQRKIKSGKKTILAVRIVYYSKKTKKSESREVQQIYKILDTF